MYQFNFLQCNHVNSFNWVVQFNVQLLFKMSFIIYIASLFKKKTFHYLVSTFEHCTVRNCSSSFYQNLVINFAHWLSKWWKKGTRFPYAMLKINFNNWNIVKSRAKCWLTFGICDTLRRQLQPSQDTGELTAQL